MVGAGSVVNMLPPLSLYIHTPWCVEKCPYCDFNSHQQRDDFDEPGYVGALLEDLAHDAPMVAGREISSIFIGGGTPSLFSAAAYARLLGELPRLVRLANDVEITLEANPGTIDEANFRGYRAAGINRLSIGVQSFDSDALKRLGRIHDGRQALSAFETGRRAGFDNINLDLMFGLPGQALNEGLSDLNLAIGLAPEHLSWYQLTIEPNTGFAHQPPVLPSDDSVADLWLEGAKQLSRAAYAQYEVSAWALDGARCRHNVNYWQFGDYLGIGAGAHGKISYADGAGLKIMRTTKQRHPQSYIASRSSNGFISSERLLSNDEVVFEFMLNALRLNGGFRRDTYIAHSGLSWDTVEANIQHQIDRGLLERESDGCKVTALGARFLNDLVESFLPDESQCSKK